MKRRPDPIASLHADGEAPPELDAARLADPEVLAELADIRRLSEALRVPADIGRSDPFFLVRFLKRRDAMIAAAQSAQPWRRVAQYLLPLAAGALLGAAVTIWFSAENGSALGELEMRALGNGVADVTLETTSVEPVLRIALGEL